MTFDWSDLVEGVGILVGIIIWSFGMWRYLVTRIDEGDKVLHARINDVREGYVRRDDLNTHLARIEKAVDRLQEVQAEHNRHMNARFDNLLTTLAHMDKKGSKE